MKKERPILFSTIMVKAILVGRKTQTRRMTGLKDLNEIPEALDQFEFLRMQQYDDGSYRAIVDDGDKPGSIVCPYGKPGDLLYVRETFYAFGHWKKTTDTATKVVEWNFHDLTSSEGKQYHYMEAPPHEIKTKRFGLGYFKRPSIHMPKAVARIWMEVVSVRLERLHSITARDVFAEGTPDSKEDFILGGSDHYSTHCWRKLWVSINGQDSWDINPFVWAIEFKKIDRNG